MAFPVVETADVQSGVITVNDTSWTLTYPTNLASGDLILAFLASDGAQASTWPAGFVKRDIGSGGAVTLCLAKKLSNGTETGTFEVTTSSEQGGWRTLRITGWEGTLGTAYQNDANSGSACDAIGGGSGTTSGDCPALDPNNWGTEDTLWIAAIAVDTSRTFSAWPTSYTPGNNTWDNVSGGAGGASLSVQHRQNAVSSEDPSAFTFSASDDYASATIAVRPAAAAGPTTSLIYPPRPVRLSL